jgi:hypothetical protein
MQGIIDVIASDISVVGESDFIADSAALSVTVRNVGLSGLNFANANGDRYFVLGDNLNIRKVWATIPYGFAQAQGVSPHTIGLAFWNGTAFETMPPFSNSTLSLNIPVLCQPLDWNDGVYVKMPVLGIRREIRLSNINLEVSQVNLPTALNTQRIPVQYFMEILHTTPMMSAP